MGEEGLEKTNHDKIFVAAPMDITIDDVTSPEADEIHGGVSVKRGVSFDEAGDVFRAVKEKILVSSGVPGIPNGDTSDRDNDQALRTGMGIDVDKFGK